MASSNVWNYQGMVVGLPVRRKAARQGSVGQWGMRKEREVSRSVIGVRTENTSGIVVTGGADERATAETVYEDNWFSLLAIHHLSQSVQNTTGLLSFEETRIRQRNGGLRSEKEGYEGLMEAASMAAKNFGSKYQQELVIQALHKAFPSFILNMIRVILPPTRFSREYFARFTTVFFSWLVGHCQVRETEFEGRKESNVVYIPKCRFLEGTKCVGMCTNMCKIPSQKFIYESLGMPLNMVPNFEDMSCEMIFGQHPPDDDPALKQLCYKKICKAKQTHGVNCSN